MKGDGSFKLVIGDEWHGAGAARDGAPPLAGGTRFDPAVARGVLDMIVDGQSLFQPADEDSVFFLVRDLLAALERLAAAEGAARVSFYESPHELVLQRIGDRVYLTFYRGGHLPEVVVKDQQVRFDAFAAGIVASARGLIESARGLAPQAAADPLLAWMAAMTDRLAALPPCPPGGGEIERRTVESTRFLKARTEVGFSFGVRFEARTTDLLCPGRPLSNDLNALLFRGRLAVHARSRRRALGEGFVFLQVEKLLASVHQLLTAWEEGRPIAIRLIAEGISVALKLTADDKLLVTLTDPAHPEAVVAVHDLTPWQYADAVLGVARELRRLIVECAPQQRRNIRLESFSREARALASWAKEQQRGAVFNEDVDRYRRLDERRRVDDAAREGIGEASRLTFRERWRIEAEGLDLDGTMLGDRVALISARGYILGAELESGAIVWRRETDRAEARMQIAGRDGVVRVAPSGQIDLIDAGTGVLRWRTSLAARSGGSPVILVADHGPIPGLVVVAEEERKLVALDLRTGEPRWRFTASRGGRFALRRHGRLLYVASSDAQLSAVDLEDGQLVWRHPGRTKFSLPPTVAGDVVLAPGGRYGKQEGRMYAFDAYSGRPLWERPLEGGALTAPIVADGVALVPVRSGGGKHDLVALDAASGEPLWRVPCDGWAESCALMALDDCFVINAAGGVLRSVRARTGEERWCAVLGPTCSDDVPVNLRLALRSGVLFVPADTVYVVRPDDGRVVHSLGGEPPVPDLMFVDPTCAVFVAEESGHVAMYELQRRFSVVNGKG